MAIAFLEVKTISRATKTKGKGGVYVSNGASSVAASAYRAGVKLLDEQTGIVHDYRPRSKKDGDVEALPVIVPDGEAPIERGELWNQVEATETRKNSMLAREMVIALPRETSREANRRMAQAMGEKLAKEFGVAVDVCIHSGRDRNDHEGSGNPHMHVLFTTRRYKSGELGEKTRELNDKTTSSGHVEDLRQFWQKVCNEELQRIQVEAIDMRSYKRQGVNKIPQHKLGRAAHHLHKRTGESYLAARNSLIKTVNVQVEADHARRIVAKLLGIADKLERKAERFDAAAREGAAPAASSQPKEKAKTEPDAAGRPQAAPQVPLDPRAEADKRARGLYEALGEFIRGGGETAEIRAAERSALRDALKACGLVESAANLELSDAHGNKGPHLLMAAAKRLAEQKQMSITEIREAREIGALFAAVKSAAVGAGYRYDAKARNLDGQLSFDVQRDGLKRLPPAVVKAVAKAARWTTGRSLRGRPMQSTGRVPALRAQAQLDQQRRPARMQLTKRFGTAAPPPRPMGFQSFGAVGDASSFSRVSSGGFPAVVGVAASSSSFDTGGGGARAAGGMQAPPPGLPPAELDAWLFAYKRAAEVQRAADEEKRRRAFSR